MPNVKLLAEKYQQVQENINIESLVESASPEELLNAFNTVAVTECKNVFLAFERAIKTYQDNSTLMAEGIEDADEKLAVLALEKVLNHLSTTNDTRYRLAFETFVARGKKKLEDEDVNPQGDPSDIAGANSTYPLAGLKKQAAPNANTQDNKPGFWSKVGQGIGKLASGVGKYAGQAIGGAAGGFAGGLVGGAKNAYTNARNTAPYANNSGAAAKSSTGAGTGQIDFNTIMKFVGSGSLTPKQKAQIMKKLGTATPAPSPAPATAAPSPVKTAPSKGAPDGTVVQKQAFPGQPPVAMTKKNGKWYNSLGKEVKAITDELEQQATTQQATTQQATTQQAANQKATTPAPTQAAPAPSPAPAAAAPTQAADQTQQAQQDFGFGYNTETGEPYKSKEEAEAGEQANQAARTAAAQKTGERPMKNVTGTADDEKAALPPTSKQLQLKEFYITNNKHFRK